MAAKDTFINEYWAERQAKAQEEVTKRGIKETEKQLIKYYQRTMSNVIGQFEQVYSKVLLSISEGATPTPADLYKLDSYWKAQTILKEELTKLGDKQAAVMSRQFIAQYRQAYRAVALMDDGTFNQVTLDNARQMINQIWCADGQSWSSRVWKNIDKLQQALNENLIDCVLTGKSTESLKKKLVEEFGVAYNRADSIVRTEYTHIQTQAARQRYEDMGVKEVEVWADYDERLCKECGKLHRKRFNINSTMPIPAHPRCRCCIIPVIEGQEEQLVLEGF
jgi:SPP1 gp7 family putative phage head morphogenesis protein